MDLAIYWFVSMRRGDPVWSPVFLARKDINGWPPKFKPYKSAHFIQVWKNLANELFMKGGENLGSTVIEGFRLSRGRTGA
jgi:hypothetical protein